MERKSVRPYLPDGDSVNLTGACCLCATTAPSGVGTGGKVEEGDDAKKLISLPGKGCADCFTGKS